MGVHPGKNSSTVLELVKFFLFSGLLVWGLAVGTQGLGYNWQWYTVPKYLLRWEADGITPGPLLEGLLVTIKLSGISLCLSFLFGLVTALLRLSHSITAHFTARVYLEAVRNTPLLIQLFLVYFVLAPILGLGAFASAVLALSLFEGAYASEIIRSGIVSIPRGQWESAYSLGLSRFNTYRFIILPQALRQTLPPLTSQAISLIKDSALVSTIAIYDLTMQGQSLVSETFLAFEIWFTVAAIYLILTLSLSILVNRMEKRLRVHVS
jgi:polar amino acid transport system permease protein